VPERYLGRSLGKYRVDSLIGSGGFAWVLRGYDPEMDIPVAIKVLKPQFAGDSTLVDRFRREASTAAKLRHPNIIKIYAVGKQDDAVYFVMDYLPSGLADKLEATNTLPEDYVVRVGIDVARALGFAHREGVIHRDIKVDNILFDTHGNAVVADFGIARAVTGYTQHTGTNMVVGTPQYFAPEQARAKPLDGRADIYSLGVTLYRAATGRLPFEGDDWYEIARQHVEDPPPPPRTIAPGLSPEFERLLLQCLAKQPDDRPANGEQLAEQLEIIRAQHRDPTLARTITVPAPQLADTIVTPALSGSRSVPRRRLTAKVLVPSAIGVIGIAATAAWLLGFGRTAQGTTPGGNVDSFATRVFGDSGAPVTDSGRRKTDSARRGDTTKGGAVMPTVHVTFPAGAQLRLNGNVVETSDTVWSGEINPRTPYVISASLHSLEGCSSATDDTTISLGPTQVRRIALRPRPCGAVEITPQLDRPAPGDASYAITTLDGSLVAQGRLSIGATYRIVLPVGSYNLEVGKPQCVPYQDRIKITASDAPLKIPFKIFC
jgi:serine/threonine-protein kinase